MDNNEMNFSAMAQEKLRVFTLLKSFTEGGLEEVKKDMKSRKDFEKEFKKMKLYKGHEQEIPVIYMTNVLQTYMTLIPSVRAMNNKEELIEILNEMIKEIEDLKEITNENINK